MRSIFSCTLSAAVIAAGSATGQIIVQNGADIDMTGSLGSQIIFPDGTMMDSVLADGLTLPAGLGGVNNSVVGENAFIGGGNNNAATHKNAAISAGANNTAGARYATIGAGQSNEVTGNYATVSGGQYNQAAAKYATIGGGGPIDINNPTTTNNVAYDDFGTIGGGGNNTAGADDADSTTQQYTTVAGGRSNTAGGAHATVGGGYYNAASGFEATVAGGVSNDASGQRSIVGGGNNNTVSGYEATVGGGLSNAAGGHRASVSGGLFNAASGSGATVPGGGYNAASGDYSFAAGRRAKVGVTHGGTFLFADQTNSDFNSAAANEFAARANGGVRFITNSGTGAGVGLTAGDTSWNVLSAKEAKENYTGIDAAAILESVAALPIQRWNYIHQDDSIQHIGPYAQDFYNAFELHGVYNGTISSQDLDGVALAAIQGLHAELQREVADRQQRIDALEARLTLIEEKLSTAAP